jgi:flagellar protein FliS
MNPGINITNYKKNANSYKEQEIMTASPAKCVIHLYDIAIQNCALENADKAAKAVAMLTDALDFDKGGEISSRLYGLYGFCIKKIHENDYDIPSRILKELRETWSVAFKSVKAA